MTNLKDYLNDFAQDVMTDVVTSKNEDGFEYDADTLKDLIDDFIQNVSVRLLGGD